MPTSDERSEGMLLAAAVGDALGWPQEMRGGLIGGQKARDDMVPQPRYQAWVRHGGSRFTGIYRDPVGAGEYSDDTQLLCSVARSCTLGDQWYRHLVEVELPTWLVYQRGGGRAVLAAASAWAEGRPPWLSASNSRARQAVARYRDAGGNGVAMRIAPHVLRAHLGDENLQSRVFLDGLTTHGHPRALIGALIYASTLEVAYSSNRTLEYGELIASAREGIVPATDVVEVLPDDWASSEEIDNFRQAWTQTNEETLRLLDVVDK